VSIYLKNKLLIIVLSVFLVKTTFSQQINFGDDYNFDKNIQNDLEFKIFPDDQENVWKNIFKNKDYVEISNFFNNLPLNSRDEVVQNIIFDILSSTKSFDKSMLSSDEFKKVFNLIVKNLFITGRFNEIEILYSQSPKLTNDSYILQKMIEGNLLRNRHSEACKILEKNFNENLVNLGKTMIMCNIINNRFEQAKLGLQLLKEQNNPGDIFFIELAFSLMMEKDSLNSKELKKTLNQVKELNPIIISSLQFADISPSFEQIESLSISGLLSLLSNPSVERELKIYCAEILVKIGRIDVDMLSDAYQLARFKQSEIEKANKLYKTLSPNRARPLLFQSILRDEKLETKIDKIVSLVKVSQNDNLVKQVSHLIDNSEEFSTSIKSHEASILISKIYQSKGMYEEAKLSLKQNYKKPESDYRKIALEMAELIYKPDRNYYELENDLELIKSIENQDSIFLKKLLMIMIMNLELDNNVVKNFRNMSISKEQKISGKDFKNLLLAEKLSRKKDFFNSISILFDIIGTQDFESLNLIESYTILTILKNLELDSELKKFSQRMLL